MIVELGAVIGVPSRIIHSAASTRGALFSAFEGHVCLGADHWFDVVVVAGFVKIQDPVHVSVVRDA